MGRRRFRISGLAIWMGVVVAFMYVPLVIVISNAFNSNKSLTSWGGFTFKWFETVVSDERVQTDFKTTVEVALISMVISLVIAVGAATWARKARSGSVTFFNVTTYMRMALPEIVIAVGLFLIFHKLKIELGMTAIIIGHVVFCSAYATIIVQARYATMNSNLEEAAGDLGATPLRAFWRVTLPTLLPGIIVAAFLILTLSADDVLTSLFLGGGNAETLPVLMLGMARREVTPEVNAIGTLFMIFTVSLFTFGALIAGIRGAAGLARGDRAAEDDAPATVPAPVT